jgi:hypothetical protein
LVLRGTAEQPLPAAADIGDQDNRGLGHQLRSAWDAPRVWALHQSKTTSESESSAWTCRRSDGANPRCPGRVRHGQASAGGRRADARCQDRLLPRRRQLRVCIHRGSATTSGNDALAPAVRPPSRRACMAIDLTPNGDGLGSPHAR